MNSDDLMADFRARYTEADRGVLARSLLATALRETPCPRCGLTAFAIEPGAAWSRFECPSCQEIVWIGGAGNAVTVLSGRRRASLLRAALRRAWFCPEHDGTRVRLTAIETDPVNPTQATLRFLCRRSRGLFKQSRAHTGAIPVNLLTLG